MQGKRNWPRRAGWTAAAVVAVALSPWQPGRAGHVATLGGTRGHVEAVGTPAQPRGTHAAAVGEVSRLPVDERVIEAPVSVSGAPPRPLPPPAVLKQPVPARERRGSTWAVVVGINDYPGSDSDLSYSVNDAEDVVSALSGLGVPSEHILLARDGQASAEVIRSSIDWLNERAGPESVAVLFYAGHVRKLSSNTEAVMAADGQLITDRELGARLSNLKAKQAWIAMATCYGGGFTELLAPGRVLTAASDADSPAYENPSFARSYLVQYMVREAMLEHRADATVQQAFAYASDRIARQYPDRQLMQVQEGDQPLDLRPPELRAADDSAPSAPPAPAPPPESSTPPPTEPPPNCRRAVLAC